MMPTLKLGRVWKKSDERTKLGKLTDKQLASLMWAILKLKMSQSF